MHRFVVLFFFSLLPPIHPVQSLRCGYTINWWLWYLLEGKYILLDPAAWERQSCCCSVVGSAPAGTCSTPPTHRAPRGSSGLCGWAGPGLLLGMHPVCPCRLHPCSGWAQSLRVPGCCPRLLALAAGPWHLDPWGCSPTAAGTDCCTFMSAHTHNLVTVFPYEETLVLYEMLWVWLACFIGVIVQPRLLYLVTVTCTWTWVLGNQMLSGRVGRVPWGDKGGSRISGPMMDIPIGVKTTGLELWTVKA